MGLKKARPRLWKGALGETIAKQSVGWAGGDVRRGWAGELGTAHVPACAGRAGEIDALFDHHVR